MADWITRDFLISNTADWSAVIDLSQVGDTWSLAGCSVSAQLTWPANPPALDLAPYISIADVPNRKVLLAVPAIALVDLVEGDYPYDVLVTTTATGAVRRRCKGTVTVEQGNTPRSALSSTALADLSGFVQQSQFLLALEDSGAGRVAAVRSAVPADPGSATNIAWSSGGYVSLGGVFVSFVKSTLGLSDAQIAAIFTAAKLKIV